MSNTRVCGESLTRVLCTLVALGATGVIYVIDDIQTNGYLSKAPNQRPEESPSIAKLVERARQKRLGDVASGKMTQKPDNARVISNDRALEKYDEISMTKVGGETETKRADDKKSQSLESSKRSSKFEEIFGDIGDSEAQGSDSLASRKSSIFKSKQDTVSKGGSSPKAKRRPSASSNSSAEK